MDYYKFKIRYLINFMFTYKDECLEKYFYYLDECFIALHSCVHALAFRYHITVSSIDRYFCLFKFCRNGNKIISFRGL